MNVVAVSTSQKLGVQKDNQPEIFILKDIGVKDDAHGGLSPARQVSLLAMEDIEEMNGRGRLELKPGQYAENITTKGLVLHTLPLGTRLKIGSHAVLEVSQIGKTCHQGCAIKEATGTCIMPTRGIFGRVAVEGPIRPGDEIIVEE